MLIVQEPWSSLRLEDLAVVLDAGLALRAAEVPDQPRLVLLGLEDESHAAAPRAPDTSAANKTVEATLAALGRLAAARRVFLAGALTGSPALGFLIDPQGRVALRANKRLPDLLHAPRLPADQRGATQPSARAEPELFAVVATPEGQVSMLVGEDALVPHFVRAAMWAGAEIILNPTRELLDEQFGIRQQARMARAYENHCNIVTASPSRVRRAGFDEQLPPASGVADEWAFPVRAAGSESFLHVALDIEALRRRRVEYFGNLCICTRPTVYAPGFRASVAAAANGGPAQPEIWRGAPSRHAQRIDRYDVLLGQVTVRHVLDAASANEVISRNVDHAIDVVARFAASPTTRLVVFPEFFLQGARMGRMPQIFDVAGINLNRSPHIERLRVFAQANRVFLCGAVLEIDDDWPGYLFNTAFILDDSGELVHRYRKIQCADVFGFMDTTPGSILERYLDRYGYEALFPVADTRIGRLATAICFDMNFPELHRALALRGAELLLHPTAEPHNVRRRAWENSRQVRAWENTMYVLSAALGGDYWEGLSGDVSTFSRGHSKVVNYDGTVMSVADGPGWVPLGGQIDLRGLRAAREDRRHCMLHWDDARQYSQAYSSHVTIPDNLAVTADARPYEGGAVLKSVIARFLADGVFVAPR
jgi:predicted amidohydrolase